MTKDSVKKTTAEFEGQIVSDKMDKTRVIEISTRKTHPKYKKIYTIVRKFVAHDEKNEYHIGDVVRFIPSKPYSKTKKFIIVGRGQTTRRQAAQAAALEEQAQVEASGKVAPEEQSKES